MLEHTAWALIDCGGICLVMAFGRGILIAVAWMVGTALRISYWVTLVGIFVSGKPVTWAVYWVGVQVIIFWVQVAIYCQEADRKLEPLVAELRQGDYLRYLEVKVALQEYRDGCITGRS